jgi:WD40 repeat protein
MNKYSSKKNSFLCIIFIFSVVLMASVFADNGTEDRIISYSIPEGTIIAYLATQDNRTMNELYIASSRGDGSFLQINPDFADPKSDVFDFKFTPDENYIIYRSDQDTDKTNDLYRAPASGGGGNNTKITPSLPFIGGVAGFSISPDSNFIAYTADGSIDNVYELYLINSATSDVTKINPDFSENNNVRYDYIPFSRDSSLLAYVADQDSDGVDELYVATTSEPINVTKINPDFTSGKNVKYKENMIAFSPDSSLIAYIADQDTNDVDELYIAPSSGAGPIRKVNPDFGTSTWDVVEFQFSPDGNHIAYIAGPKEGIDYLYQLYLAPVSGSENVIKINPDFSDILRDVTSFRFSNDSSKIAYRADQDTNDLPELYMADDIDSGTIQVRKINDIITGGNSHGVYDFSFSPDGELFGYIHEVPDYTQGGGLTNDVKVLFTVPVSGSSSPVRRSPDPADHGWQSQVKSFTFSTKGYRVAFLFRPEVNTASELYSAWAKDIGDAVKVNPALVTGGQIRDYSFSPLDIDVPPTPTPTSTPTPSPSPTPTPTATPEKGDYIDFILGKETRKPEDANNDGKIDVADIIYLLLHGKK